MKTHSEIKKDIVVAQLKMEEEKMWLFSDSLCLQSQSAFFSSTCCVASVSAAWSIYLLCLAIHFLCLSSSYWSTASFIDSAQTELTEQHFTLKGQVVLLKFVLW